MSLKLFNLYSKSPLKGVHSTDGITTWIYFWPLFINHLNFDIKVIVGTNPTVWDTDGDSWSDGNEVTKYHTNPINIDTDYDNVNDNVDIDPLVDLEVTVKISEILALEDVDPDNWWTHNPADFYLRVMIYDTWFQSAGDYIELDNDHIYPDTEFTKNVPDSVENIYVMIELYDDDGSEADDDWCDISVRDTDDGDQYSASNTDDDGRRVILTYNLKTSQWSGDDSPGDANGWGMRPVEKMRSFLERGGIAKFGI